MLTVYSDSISDTQERLVDDHEKSGDNWKGSDSSERRQHGSDWAGNPVCIFREEDPTTRYNEPNGEIPPGVPERGGG